MTERDEINGLLAKVYAELATEHLEKSQAGAETTSRLYQLHAREVNAYYAAVGNSPPRTDVERDLAKSVVRGFAQVLSPAEAQKLIEWFHDTNREAAFAEGIKSVFRSHQHSELRPYSPPTLAGDAGNLTMLGW